MGCGGPWEDEGHHRRHGAEGGRSDCEDAEHGPAAGQPEQRDLVQQTRCNAVLQAGVRYPLDTQKGSETMLVLPRLFAF